MSFALEAHVAKCAGRFINLPSNKRDLDCQPADWVIDSQNLAVKLRLAYEEDYVQRAPQKRKSLILNIYPHCRELTVYPKTKIGFLSLSACHGECSPVSPLIPLHRGRKYFFYRGPFSGVRYGVTGGYGTALYWIVLSRTLLKLTVKTS